MSSISFDGTKSSLLAFTVDGKTTGILNVRLVSSEDLRMLEQRLSSPMRFDKVPYSFGFLNWSGLPYFCHH